MEVKAGYKETEGSQKAVTFLPAFRRRCWLFRAQAGSKALNTPASSSAR